MQGKPAIYLGRVVDKNHFRVFIYGAHGEQKLVESWDEFEAHMQTGIWFAENIKENKSKPRKRQKPIADETVFEVTDEA